MMRLWKKTPPKQASPSVTAEGEAPAVATEGWTKGREFAQTAVSAAILGGLLAGPTALGLVLFGPEPSVVAAPVSTAPVGVTSDQQAAGAVAVEVLEAYLSATKDDVTALRVYLESVDQSSFGDAPVEYRSARLVSVTQPDPASPATAVVSAQVKTSNPSEKDPKRDAKPESWTVRYWQIAIGSTSEGPSVLGLPTETAAPTPVAAPESAYTVTVAKSDQAYETVQAFVTAQLAGSGEITRYVTPGVEIQAVSPAPFEEVEVKELKATVKPGSAPGNGDQVHVQAYVVAKTATGSQPTTVWLTLTARDQRWEVSALDPAPVLKLESTPTTSPTSVPPTPSHT